MGLKYTGTVDGNGVAFYLSDDCLEWGHFGKETKNSIKTDRIITILPHSDEPNTSIVTVLYLEETAPASESGKERNVPGLKRFDASGLPQAVIRRYAYSCPPHLQLLPSEDGHSNIHVI